MSRKLYWSYREGNAGIIKEKCPYYDLLFRKTEDEHATRVGSNTCGECQYNQCTQHTVHYVMCKADEVISILTPPVVVIPEKSKRVFRTAMIKRSGRQTEK